jgi:hypothetical protein
MGLPPILTGWGEAMKRFVFALTFATAVLTAAPAHAACVASNLKGKTFTTYFLRDFVGFRDGDKVVYNSVARYTFKVRANGYIRLNDKCYDSNGQHYAYIVGGRLNIKSNCQVVGKIRYGSNSGETTIAIKHARMDRGKTVINGHVRSIFPNGSWSSGTINFIRH